jgi:hypothetical protein
MLAEIGTSFGTVEVLDSGSDLTLTLKPKNGAAPLTLSLTKTAPPKGSKPAKSGGGKTTAAAAPGK